MAFRRRFSPPERASAREPTAFIRRWLFSYWRSGVREIINLQPLSGGKAKAYQVKQVRDIITRYGLQLRQRP